MSNHNLPFPGTGQGNETNNPPSTKLSILKGFKYVAPKDVMNNEAVKKFSSPSPSVSGTASSGVLLPNTTSPEDNSINYKIQLLHLQQQQILQKQQQQQQSSTQVRRSSLTGDKRIILQDTSLSVSQLYTDSRSGGGGGSLSSSSLHPSSNVLPTTGSLPSNAGKRKSILHNFTRTTTIHNQEEEEDKDKELTVPSTSSLPSTPFPPPSSSSSSVVQPSLFSSPSTTTTTTTIASVSRRHHSPSSNILSSSSDIHNFTGSVIRSRLTNDQHQKIITDEAHQTRSKVRGVRPSSKSKRPPTSIKTGGSGRGNTCTRICSMIKFW